MNKRNLVIFAWAVTLLVSVLPTIIFQEIFKYSMPWLSWVKMGILAIALVLTLLIKNLRPLWMYITVLIVLYLAEWVFHDVIGNTPFWLSRFGVDIFTVNMFGNQLLRLGVTLTIVFLMVILKKKWSAFFLVKGDLGAEAKPIPLLMDKPTSWKKLGWILAACISGGTLAFLLLAGQPTPETLLLALPFLPVVFVLAAMNAFNEEMSYRAGPLASLHEVIGPQQALLMTAAFFGIGHFYGVPYGIIGVLMASLLGWLLGKAMLETKGFFWAWFIHFLQDVLIFSFMFIGSVTPGG